MLPKRKDQFLLKEISGGELAIKRHGLSEKGKIVTVRHRRSVARGQAGTFENHREVHGGKKSRFLRMRILLEGLRV